MKKEDLELLEYILKVIHIIKDQVEGVSFQEFASDLFFQAGITKLIEEIGESVKELSQEVKEVRPDVPWKDIAGMRDILVHDYRERKLKVIWQTVEKDIPLWKQ